MRVIAIGRPERHPKALPVNYKALLENAKKYIAERKIEGKIIDAFFGFGSRFQSMYWVVEADNPNEMWSILSGMPYIDGTPWHWETHPVVECDWMIDQRLIQYD